MRLNAGNRMAHFGAFLTYAKRGLVVSMMSMGSLSKMATIVDGVFVESKEKVVMRKISDEKVYRSVRVASLGNRRRGKHHDLVGGIMRQLKSLNAGSALEIPLEEGVVELENLRSAVHRAAAAQNLAVHTQSDERNFYVWISEVM